MLFTSLIFVFVFLPIVLIGHNMLKGSYRNYFLLVASIVFYAWGEPKFVLVMMLSIILNYIFGLLIGLKKSIVKKRVFLAFALICNIGILFIFKYLGFAVSNIDKIFNDLLPQVNIALPIGISFFTFQAMSYVIDVYKSKVNVQKNPFFLGLYISLFPQLIAGPIVRYAQIEKEIYYRKVTIDDFGEGARRFIIGFCKKVIIANNVALVADWAFAYDGTISTMGAWLGAICFTLQIYFDFSGYSDMAIGLGRMLGFHFSENFIYPYLSKSATEFWRRWHISMGSWFRDYVYIPLGGSRVKSNGRHMLNIFIVWLCTGAWHGAGWTFLTWGMLYCVLLIFEKSTGLANDSENKVANAFKHIYTMFFVIIGWVIFKDAGLEYTIDFIKSMFMLNGCPMATPMAIYYLRNFAIIIIIGIIYSLATFDVLKKKLLKDKSERFINIFTIISTISYAVMFIVAISYLVMGSYNPFIYFNF